MKRFILIFLWIPLYSFASTSPELDIQIDSLQQVIENAAHDTITFKAQLEWAKLVHPSDWESGIEIADKIEKACNTLLDEASNDSEKMLYLKYLDNATYLKGEIYNQNGEFEKSIELFKRSLGFAEELGYELKQVDYISNIGVRYCIRGDSEKATEYFQRALEKNKEFDDKEGMALTYLNLGMVNQSMKNEMDIALDYFIKALEISKSIDYQRGVAISSHNIGVNYQVKGNLTEANRLFYSALKIFESLGLKANMAGSLAAIGGVYQQQKEYDQALDFYSKAKEINEEIGNQKGLVLSWKEIGAIHELQGNIQKALPCYQTSLKISEQIGYTSLIATNALYIGGVYLVRQELDTALIFHEKALSIFKESKNEYMESETLLGLGKIYLQQGNERKAIKTVQQGYNLAKSAEALTPQQHTAEWLYENYKKTGDNQLALEMYEASITIRDSMQNEESRQENIRQAIQYDYDKKSMADSLQNVQEQQIMQGEMVAQKQRFNLLLGGFGIAALLMSLLFYFYKKLGKANEISKKQAIMISQSNSELSKSLEHQMMLQGEIHHRVKNNLQVIISLLELQKEDITDVQAQESLEAMSGRIFSMSAIHEILYQKEGVAQIQFSDYAENLCRHFGDFSTGDDRPLFDLRIKNFEFNLETSMPLGIILTELLTNSLKYGRKPDQRLHISISLEKLDQWFSLVYRDNGAGFPTGKLKEREGGLGSYLLRSMTRQLKGQIKTENDNGAVYTIYFMGKESSKITTPTRSTITTKA